jgi:hypothetical protein
MAQWLNKFIVAALCLMFTLAGWCQPATGGYSTDDYKDPKSHEKFRKRRITVAAWQINQLKRGALVVRLPTDQLLINELKKRGEEEQAEKARIEQAAENINMIRAFRDHYRFSKVYFMSSNNSDSLMKGARTGIFLDTNLKPNPAIRMTENFYLIAESDFVYNSSIGFVREDSAQYMVERGNPSSIEMPVVIKNKFGHQLKNPFPYTTGRFVFAKNVPTTEIYLEGKPVIFEINNGSGRSRGGEKNSGYTYNGKQLQLSIPKSMTYEVLSQFVQELNAELERFYAGNSGFSENNKNYEDSKPFFY